MNVFREKLLIGFMGFTMALACVADSSRVAAGVVAESHDTLQFEYQQPGANEEEAVRLACIRAVNATIGRQLQSDYRLQARELLAPYIQRNWQRFVASYYVQERRAERDGFGVRIRVLTFPEVVTRDLREKRFLHIPRPIPHYFVAVDSQTAGQVVDASGTARALADTASQAGKVVKVRTEAPRADLDPILAAREAAIRAGADIALIGFSETRQLPVREVYYENMSTFETRLNLRAVLASDGRLLSSADIVQRASDVKPDVARVQSLKQATDIAVAKLLSESEELYAPVALDSANFSVMLSDVSPEEAEMVASHINGQLGHGTEAKVRDLYAGVGIIAVATPHQYAMLERSLQDFKAFNLRITDRKGKRIMVDVKH